jgi:hypothetical protein
MTKNQAKKAYFGLRAFYNNSEPPIDVVADQLKVPIPVATEMVVQFNTKRKPALKKPPPTPGIPPWILTLLRWPMLVFAAVAFYLSCYFSIQYLKERQPAYIAWLISVALIGFGNFSFEIAAFTRKQGKKGASWLFLLAWAFILVYSVSTTIGSLYNSYVDTLFNKETVLVQTNAARMEYSNLLANEKNKNTELDDKRKRLSIQQGILATFDTLEKQRADRKGYGDASWLSTVYERDTKKLGEELSKIREQLTELIQKNPEIARDIKVEKKPDYYEWLAKIFKSSADWIQFIMQTIPAVVLDIISSASLYVFLFLNNIAVDYRKKKE